MKISLIAFIISLLTISASAQIERKSVAVKTDSEQTTFKKPDYKIFEHALNQANALKTESIMIGDNIDADILGAKNAGLDSIFVNHLNNEKFTEANFTAFKLKDLEAIF